MTSTNDIITKFFKALKHYNLSNFKTLLNVDVKNCDTTLLKSFSSVITRYFIFKEHHPEYSETELNMLYFKLRIDLIARYFSEYPSAQSEDLEIFQAELRRFAKQDESDKEESADVKVFYSA